MDLNLNPMSLCADHVIVALHIPSSPDEPGVAMLALLLTGPFQLMSKVTWAFEETGCRNLNSPLGMLKKSFSGSSVALMCAEPSPT